MLSGRNGMMNKNQSVLFNIHDPTSSDMTCRNPAPNQDRTSYVSIKSASPHSSIFLQLFFLHVDNWIQKFQTWVGHRVTLFSTDHHSNLCDVLASLFTLFTCYKTYSCLCFFGLFRGQVDIPMKLPDPCYMNLQSHFEGFLGQLFLSFWSFKFLYNNMNTILSEYGIPYFQSGIG